MATEGRILTAADVSGGNPVRTVVQSTQANDEGAPSNKDVQVMALGDPTTAANLAAVDSSGRLSVTQRDANTSRAPLVGTFQVLNTADLIGLVNSTFYTTTSITDNYTTAHTGSANGTVALNDGFALLSTGTTNPSTAQITSKDYASYNGLGELMFLNGLRAPQAGTANVIKRWGAYDGTNGYFFEDNGGTFTVVAIKGGTRTAVASGSFNGLLGTTYTLDQNSHFFQILMTGGRSIFMIDQTVLHTLSAGAGVTTTSGSLTLPIRVEIVSTQTVNQTLELRGQNIGRLGPVDSKRLNEGILDNADSALVRAVPAAQTGTANTYVNQTATVAGTKNSLDINIAGSSGGVAAVSQVISTTATAAATGTTSTTAIALANVTSAGNATVALVGGTYTALTVNFEVCPEPTGTYWVATDASRADGTGVDISATFTAAGVRLWNIIAPGYYFVRARVSALTATGNPTILINQGPFLYDPSPAVAPLDGQKPTYTANISGLVTNTAIDLASLVGSATKTIRVTRVIVELTTTTAATASADIRLSKRSTAGTPAASSGTTVIGPNDTLDAAATATALGHAVAGTPGTQVAIPAAARIPLATGRTQYLWEFGRLGRAVVLRGTAERLTFVQAAIATTGVFAWTIQYEWTEE